LTALIRVVDHLQRMPLVDGHLQRIQDQICLQVIGHCPASNSSAEGIDNHRQIWEPFRSPDVVISATQSLSGRSALKSRSTRSGAGRAPGLRRAVRVLFRRLAPCKPTALIRRATRLLPTCIPASFRSSQMRSTP